MLAGELRDDDESKIMPTEPDNAAASLVHSNGVHLTTSRTVQRVEEATGAVIIDNERRAVAILVTPLHVLVNIRSHSLLNYPINIEFSDDNKKVRTSATPLKIGADHETASFRVFLLKNPLNDIKPIQLWPASLLPRRLHIYDPLAIEFDAWTEALLSKVAGNTFHVRRVGNNRADIVSGGAPVVDTANGKLVGVVINDGGDNSSPHAVRLSRLRRTWPQLPRPWLYAGEDGVTHFRHRATGQRSLAHSDDLFQGRRTALSIIDNWLKAEADPGRPLVVTASPGSGKSAVVARAAQSLEERKIMDGVAFHARQSTIDDLINAIGLASGVTATSWKEMITKLSEIGRRDPMALVIDAIDEVSSRENLAEFRRLVRELARISWIRLVVATRKLDSRSELRPGTHLYELGVTTPNSDNLLDLDADQFFYMSDLRAYAFAVLTTPGPKGLSWERYRDDPALCERLAEEIAKRTNPNFLVAGMASFQLSEDSVLVDPHGKDFKTTMIPTEIGEALGKHVERLPPPARRRVLGVLTALAYARGIGLDDQRWLKFACALGFTGTTPEDLVDLRESAAADYLLETTSEQGIPVARLFHEALSDELRKKRNELNDEAAILATLERETKASGWPAAPWYIRRHLASHAHSVKALDRLLNQAGFLASVQPQSLRPYLKSVGTRRTDDPSFIYGIAYPFLGDDIGRNAAVLELVSTTQGNLNLARQFRELPGIHRPFRARGLLRPIDQSLVTFDRHTGPVEKVVTLKLAELENPVVMTTSHDGTARVWDPRRPDTELARTDRYESRTRGIATIVWPGLDHHAVVIACWDGSARIVDPLRPDIELSRFNCHHGPVENAVTLNWPGIDHEVVATTSHDKTAQIWDPQRPGVELATFVGHTDWVLGVDVLDFPGRDHPVVVTTSHDKTARIWDPLNPTVELARFSRHKDPVWMSKTLDWPGIEHPVVITTSYDGTARIWDPLNPDDELAQFNGHTNWVLGIALIQWPGLDHKVVITTSYDDTARIWDPQHPDIELARFDGHTNIVVSAVVLEWPGLDHPVVLTTSYDSTARIWDPHKPEIELARFNGHNGPSSGITNLGTSRFGRPVVVTSSFDRTARVWDPHNPDAQMRTFTRHTDRLRDVASFDWAGRDHPVVITTSDDGTARVWDPNDPAIELAVFTGHADRVRGATSLYWPALGRSVIVTTSFDGTARVWDPMRPDNELACFAGHSGTVWCAMSMAWPRLDHPAVVTVSDDRTACVWDPYNPETELARFVRHTDRVRGVVALEWPSIDHSVLATVSWDGTARIWDPVRPDSQLAQFEHADAIWGIDTIWWQDVHHRVVVTASLDGTARVWNPWQTDQEFLRVPLIGAGMDVTTVDFASFAVATSRGFLVVSTD